MAQAQVEAAAPAWRFTPSFTLTESWSDNLHLLSEPFARPGWATLLVPALQLRHTGPRLDVFADYRYQRTLYTSGDDESQNYLRARATYDVANNRLFVEANANITQENRSAFGPGVVPGAPGSNPNRVEARLFSVSPFVRGDVGDSGFWQARFNQSDLRTSHENGFGATRQKTSEALASVRSVRWALDASDLRTRTDATGSLTDQRVRADLILAPTSQAHVLLVAGYERTDFTGDGRRSDATPGAGLEWSPGPRTQLSAIAQRRFFGTGHVADLSHRTHFTAWRLSSRRDSSILTNLLASNAGGLESLMSSLLVSSIADPAARLASARQRLWELGGAATIVNSGFLTERPFVYRSLEASMVLLAPRDSGLLELRERTETALGAGASAPDSFILSDEIRQRGYSAAWTHRLTPLTSFTLAASGVHTSGAGGSGPTSREDLATFYVTSRLGPHTSASFGVRRVDFAGSTQAASYRENAVFTSLSVRL